MHFVYQSGLFYSPMSRKLRSLPIFSAGPKNSTENIFAKMKLLRPTGKNRDVARYRGRRLIRFCFDRKLCALFVTKRSVMFWFSSKIQKQRGIPVFRGEKGRISKRVPGREKTGIYLLGPWVRESPRSLYFSRGNWVFITAGRIWIPVFFALSSTVLRPRPEVAKKPE